MTADYADYLNWLSKGTWIRVCARAIIFNPAHDHILVERNDWMQNLYFNFIGGGVEVNETLQGCIAREIAEETDAQITACRYLFVVENFFPHEDQIMHSLEHYFQIDLDRQDVKSKNDDVTYQWLAIAQLKEIDLRPTGVRDVIADNTLAQTAHLLLRDS